ncbi:uncharacterized protein [Arachis hypogaea]|uniref:uncharacterized protein n=1 Tax=Arachis hypogaea TaxID=3818 RepID=UPI000DEC56E6|nr:uncharacterized protein LOC112728141 [Arachis hypogaea]QHO24988.1 uncharacterized protein DS421_12g377140 [Arachis hypogaea]
MLNAKVDQISQKSSSNSVLQIKQDDKFFCRLLSKETSMANPSFRFSSSSVNVPFVWESQPGTPKYKLFSQETLPPLTPPPSYHNNNNNNLNNNALKRVKKNNSRSSSNIFMALFTKMSLKKIITPSHSPSPSPSCSLSSRWTTSDSSKVVPMAKIGRRRFLSYGSSSFDFRGANNEEDGGGSSSPPPSSSALCFAISRAMSSNSGFQSSYKRKAQ